MRQSSFLVAVAQEFAVNDQYEIRLQGHLGARWSQWFNELVIRHERDETILTGPISDQAALHGILAKIRDLGIPLLALKQLHDSFSMHSTGEDSEANESSP
jgi:hypothetical protein